MTMKTGITAGRGGRKLSVHASSSSRGRNNTKPMVGKLVTRLSSNIDHEAQ